MVSQSHRKNKKTKKNKISGPMGSQSHWKTKKKSRFQYQWSWTRIIDTEILIVFALFSQWFGYPLVMKLCSFCVFLVFSMALATHWSWNLGFIVLVYFLYGFSYPLIKESWFSYDMLCYVTYDGKSCYVMIRRTMLCYDMLSCVMICQSLCYYMLWPTICCVMLRVTINHAMLWYDKPCYDMIW